MNAIRLVTEDAADPENPNRTIRRQRRDDPLRKMLKSGDIDGAHWLAADRFRDKLDLAGGAREVMGSSHQAPWQRCHYAVKQADARQEVRDSLQAVGLLLSPAFNHAVIQYTPIRAMERELGIRNGKGPDAVRMALDKLARWQARNTR